MDTILKFGARLRAARKAAGFKTSKEFLQKYSVPASTYSQHESGARSPNEEMLLFYSKVFGVTIDWLKIGKGLPYSRPSLDQKNIMSEELIDIKHPNQKLLNINQPLLSKILEEILKLNHTNLSTKKIKSISNHVSKIYTTINNSGIPKKSQQKILKKLLSALK